MTSPLATPEVISICPSSFSPSVTMRSSMLVVLHDVDAARAGDRFDRAGGHEQRRRGVGLTNERGREEARLEAGVGVRRNGFDRQRALIGAQRRRDELHRRRELLAGIGVDREPDLLTRLDERHGLFRDRQLDAQRIDPHDGRDARAARDVVADADQPLGDDPGQRCAHGGVGDRLAGERDPGASALERAIRLIGEVLRRLILLARRLELRTALVELALRDDLLVDSDRIRLNSASARSSVALAFITSGTFVRSNGWPETSPSLASIWAALASASCSWADVSEGEMRTSSVPWVTRVPRSTGVSITRPAVSALTSACASALSEPVTRR